MTMLDRSRLRQRVEGDPVLRQRFDELVAEARDLTGSDRDSWEVLADLMTLAIDLGPQQPPKVYDGDPSKPWSEQNRQVRYASRSFAIALLDISMRREDMELKYSFLHVLRYMRDGITPKELEGLGLPKAWDEIVTWVMRQRGAIVYELQRDSGESDEEFESRRQLFVDSHGEPR